MNLLSLIFNYILTLLLTIAVLEQVIECKFCCWKRKIFAIEKNTLVKPEC